MGRGSGDRARSARTGRYVKTSTAARHPRTTVVEKTLESRLGHPSSQRHHRQVREGIDRSAAP
jgi:hypothetical protein